ncbi:MAG TPA: DegV family protein [Symbiobacteriaceae bacterium]|nr:DegV family protein [Symbiobacteriaceae bacterium]
MPTPAIITDSTCDLSPELLERYHLTVVPMIVEHGDETYQDGVTVTPDRLFELVERTRQLPKTASPSPVIYREVFAAATAGGGQAIYLGISSRLSAGVQNATIGAQGLERVHVVDTANLSTGIGLLALYACDLARDAKSAAEIVAALEQARPKVRSSFMVDTLDYLHMGGRCTGVQALLGSLLKLRPVISVVDGALVVTAKVRGARHKGLDYMLECFAQDVQQGLVRPDRVFVTHTGCPDDAQYMADAARRIMPEVGEVLQTRAGAVVSSHCGPGTIGILYMLK